MEVHHQQSLLVNGDREGLQAHTAGTAQQACRHGEQRAIRVWDRQGTSFGNAGQEQQEARQLKSAQATVQTGRQAGRQEYARRATKGLAHQPALRVPLCPGGPQSCAGV